MIDNGIPEELNQIQSIFVTDLRNISKLLIDHRQIVFYDTCSFAFHAIKSGNKYYALDFFDRNDIVVFTENIIKECTYKPYDYINYFKELKATVKDLILIKESDYPRLLKLKSSEDMYPKIKNVYSNAFRQNKNMLGKIKDLKPNSKKFFQDLMEICNVEENKKNLGEISIYICIQIFCFMKKNNYKIYSDDYSAFLYLKNLTKDIEQYFHGANIGYCSTLKNLYNLKVKEELNKDIVENYISALKLYEEVNYFIKQNPYDNIIKVKKKKSELLELIMDNNKQIVF